MPTDSASLFDVLASSDFFPRRAFCVVNGEGRRVFESKHGPLPSENAHVETFTVMGRQYRVFSHRQDADRIRGLKEMIEALATPREHPPLLYAASSYRSFLHFVRHEIVANPAFGVEEALLGYCVIPSGEAFFSASLIAVIMLVRSGVSIRSIDCVKEGGGISLSLTADAPTLRTLVTAEPFLFEMMERIAEARRFALTACEEQGSVTLTLRAVCIPDIDAVMHATLYADLVTAPEALFPFCLLKGFMQ